MFNARMNQAIEHGCNWNDDDVPYSELENATSRSIICCCNLLLWTSENISGLIDRTVMDIAQLGCLELADSLPAISCTFPCQVQTFVHCQQPTH